MSRIHSGTVDADERREESIPSLHRKLLRSSGKFVVSTKTKGYRNMKQWYEELFENYGMKYDNECFTQGTIGAVSYTHLDVYKRQA